jgi:hypothetical protein
MAIRSEVANCSKARATAPIGTPKGGGKMSLSWYRDSVGLVPHEEHGVSNQRSYGNPGSLQMLSGSPQLWQNTRSSFDIQSSFI